MNNLSFIFGLLCLISIDLIVAIIIYFIWRYIDLKYFSKLEISILKEENEYLKKENKKVSGTSADFWKEG